jgi:hypothetical protein
MERRRNAEYKRLEQRIHEPEADGPGSGAEQREPGDLGEDDAARKPRRAPNSGRSAYSRSRLNTSCTITP